MVWVKCYLLYAIQTKAFIASIPMYLNDKRNNTNAINEHRTSMEGLQWGTHQRLEQVTCLARQEVVDTSWHGNALRIASPYHAHTDSVIRSFGVSLLSPCSSYWPNSRFVGGLTRHDAVVPSLLCNAPVYFHNEVNMQQNIHAGYPVILKQMAPGMDVLGDLMYSKSDKLYCPFAKREYLCTLL